MKRKETNRLSIPCPKCGAKSGEPCINLSSRATKWQTWEPAPHEERK